MESLVERAITNVKNFFSDTTHEQIPNSYYNSVGYRILGNVGSPRKGVISHELGLKDVCDFIMPRREFRHAYLASTAAFIWGIVESIILVIAAIFTKPFDSERKMDELAKKSVIQCASNGAFAAIGFIGQFSPKIATKAIGELTIFVNNQASRH